MRTSESRYSERRIGANPGDECIIKSREEDAYLHAAVMDVPKAGADVLS
jgi:hypothetical protein